MPVTIFVRVLRPLQLPERPQPEVRLLTDLVRDDFKAPRTLWSQTVRPSVRSLIDAPFTFTPPDHQRRA